jgi:hypothetical protein
MTEQQPFTVLRTFDDFELRLYPAHVLVQVQAKGDFASAGSQGFGPLFRYISGNNAAAARIPMTAPVLQAPIPADAAAQSFTVSFVLPDGTDALAAPLPTDARVSTVAVPERVVAARRFGGSWNEGRFAAHGQELRDALGKEGIETDGEVYFARYDAPWKPGFLKRNEALVAVQGVAGA